MQPFAPEPHYKHALDLHPQRYMYDAHDDSGAVVPEQHTLDAAHMWSAPYPASYNPPSSRGSLLDELYDQPEADYFDRRHQQPAAHHWATLPQTAHAESPLPHTMRHVHDIAMTRRNTFPYVRQDRAEAMYTPPPFMGSDHDSVSSSPYGSRPGTVYSEPLSIDNSPQLTMCEPLHPHMEEPFAHTVPSPHPYPDYHHLDGIKTEDAPVIVPSQTAFMRPGSGGMHPLPCLQPHNGILVQHTDDAASKETQYLRRRCNNCHTTEPPSWRRSTLNPGKIVCNKCGLYERTHLRPRPLRFDELRAGSKSRKQPKGAGSPKAGKLSPMVKKEPGEGQIEGSGMMPRRSSVSSSTGSSVSSDWDDNVSVYSSGSAPPSSMGSPAAQTYPIPRDANSQSPPLAVDGGIRLPNAPLSDIAGLQQQQHPHTPRKSATAPMPYYSQQQQQQQPDYYRRGSLSAPHEMRPLDVPIPEVTGWQSVPMPEPAAKAHKVVA
ncbi:hypothetical protein WOLCODRAFT_24381 [Wolfiporia cocos MD-104 SS10]|uniref:GATA-type domain-containing protein n=1 Tax=Wolfiporia cocos (strain MD-104) TaxID=742152 RepID=A0A2H3JFF8_WOLCO|nr:hypothetical protein WOLCODRAFT_24381 [Wolfiporia cocos MD-104 SS10]